MILNITHKELKSFEIKPKSAYWFDIYIDGFLRVCINSDREDLTIALNGTSNYIDFYSEQTSGGINISLFEEWRDSILMYPDLSIDKRIMEDNEESVEDVIQLVDEWLNE